MATSGLQPAVARGAWLTRGAWVSWPRKTALLNETACDGPRELPRLRNLPSCSEDMWLSPKFSLSTIHVRLTAKGLLRNLRLPSGFRKSTVIFHTGRSGVDLCLAWRGGHLDGCASVLQRFSKQTDNRENAAVFDARTRLRL